MSENISENNLCNPWQVFPGDSLLMGWVMNERVLSRRHFFRRSCSGVGAAWLAAHMPEIVAAREHAHRVAGSAAPARLDFFSPEQAAEVEAVAGQILPTDSTPGAREAQVIYFIDRA